MSEFEGKKIVITGGTKGLGFSFAKMMVDEGAEVFLVYRNDDDAAGEAYKKLSGRPHLIKCDLSEEDATDRLFDEIREKTAMIDCYVHNAAATAFKPLMEIKSHHVDKTFNITVKSFILGVQRAAAMMPAGGAIVSVSGMDNLKMVPRHGLLGAAKSALETLTSYFAHELAPKKIRVNCVNPGFLETESTRKYLGDAFEKFNRVFTQATPLKRGPELSEIANVMAFLCSEKSSWIVGQTINVDGGQDFTLPFMQ